MRREKWVTATQDVPILARQAAQILADEYGGSDSVTGSENRESHEET